MKRVTWAFTALALLVSAPSYASSSGILANYSWDRSQVGHALDLNGYTPTFSDEFDAPTITGRNGTGPWWSPVHADFGKAHFVEPSAQGPFFYNSGILTIRAQKQPDGTYTTGHFQSAGPLGQGFLQSMGYFEMRAKFPSGKGAWPSFWLHAQGGATFPQDTSNEIDAIEWYSGDPKGLHNSLHIWPAPKPLPGEPTTHSYSSNYAGLSDPALPSSGFHTYGVEITDKAVIYYFDRQEVGRYPVQPQFKLPVYMLISLAMYDTAGAPDTLDMQVDYVKAWAKNSTGQRAFENVIWNGNFEFSNLAYWSINSTDGAYIDPLTPGSGTVARAITNVQQGIRGMKAGQSYVLSAQGRVDTAGDQGLLRLYSLDASGNIVLDKRLPVTSINYSTIQTTFTLPANAVSSRITYTRSAGKGYVYLDNVRLERPIFPPLVPVNIVKNPGLESGTTFWKPWGTATAVNDNAHTGGSAIRVGTRSGGFEQNIVSQIVAGHKYRISGYGKVDSPTYAKGYIGIKFLNANGGVILESARMITATTYTPVTFDITAPAGATSVIVYAYKKGSLYFYADDLSVIELPS